MLPSSPDMDAWPPPEGEVAQKGQRTGPSFGVIASHQEVAEKDGLLCRREAV